MLVTVVRLPVIDSWGMAGLGPGRVVRTVTVPVAKAPIGTRLHRPEDQQAPLRPGGRQIEHKAPQARWGMGQAADRSSTLRYSQVGKCPRRRTAARNRAFRGSIPRWPARALHRLRVKDSAGMGCCG
jgi:hypothetical protein